MKSGRWRYWSSKATGTSSKKLSWWHQRICRNTYYLGEELHVFKSPMNCNGSLEAPNDVDDFCLIKFWALQKTVVSSFICNYLYVYKYNLYFSFLCLNVTYLATNISKRPKFILFYLCNAWIRYTPTYIYLHYFKIYISNILRFHIEFNANEKI